MSAFEMWWCDWHSSAGPESDDDVVNEDEARDRGWVRIERTVKTPSALEGGRSWSRLEVNHVCPGCIKDSECIDWITREGFTGYFSEDAAALAAAGASGGRDCRG